MPKKAKKSAFGLALTHILLDKELTQQDLERLLNVAEGLISKYGILPNDWQDKRVASADIVYHIVEVLDLNEEQEATLIDARNKDAIWKFKQEYNALIQKKQENVSKERVNIDGLIYIRQK